jgi:hypothetical protein
MVQPSEEHPIRNVRPLRYTDTRDRDPLPKGSLSWSAILSSAAAASVWAMLSVSLR